ncbi:MAG: 30S ribosomal protein S12 methylthiotransferase RimO [Clostridia bacterium]|nr:30S ribosomal protein S12 methylthiotransferase RimO [Clostridia bacterium]
MLTKKSHQNIHIITLGCSKNIVDSEVLSRQLKAGGYAVQHDAESVEGGIVIINTCGFINDAKEESIETILQFAKARKDARIDRLYVMGCLSQRYKSQLEDEIHEVDAFYGVSDLAIILNDLKVDYRKELIGERTVTTPRHYAYLKISEGCDRNCAFCAIPLIRGKHVSRTIESLVAEAHYLVANGVKELILIAQDITWYGLDIYRRRALAELVRALSTVPGLKWIRLHYAYPAGFPMDVLEVMRDAPNVCRYLDIPLQHISDPILRTMQRGHTADQTRELLQKLRASIPGVALRTTLIVGFPGETENDFEALKAFVAEQKFERLGVFPYSHEEDTPAYALADDVPEEVKQERALELMALQEDISLELNNQHIGKIYNTIIDRKEGEYWVGRTEYDSPEVDNEVLIGSSYPLIIGEFYMIKIIGAEPFDLYGEPAGEE